MGFRALGVGFGVQCLGFRVWGQMFTPEAGFVLGHQHCTRSDEVAPQLQAYLIKSQRYQEFVGFIASDVRGLRDQFFTTQGPKVNWLGQVDF